MKKPLSVLLGVVGIAVVVSIARADEFVDLTSLARDVDAGFAGLETIMPYFEEGADTNADGAPDTLILYFNVYQGGTLSKIRKTVTKTINLPAVPCTTPITDSVESEWNPKFLGRVDSTRGHMLVGYHVACSENDGNSTYKEAYKTIVYSANLATGSGVWVYGVGRSALGMNGVDLDGDGVTESLMLATEANVAAGKNAVMRIMNANNGTVISEVSYPLVR
jgi:hypothetical protein